MSGHEDQSYCLHDSPPQLLGKKREDGGDGIYHVSMVPLVGLGSDLVFRLKLSLVHSKSLSSKYNQTGQVKGK